MKLRTIFNFLLLVGVFFTLPLTAQVVKHPRTFQLERSLQTDIEQSLKLLLMDKPFSVSVMIDPLRRASANSEKSSLPLLDIHDNVSDEWDDPNRFDYELLARVNRISVTANVPEQLSKSQVEDIKDLIRKKLPYVEGRDLIQIEQKALMTEESQPQYYKWIAILGGLGLFGLAIVNLFTNLIATNRLSKAIKSIKIDVANNSAGASLSAPTNKNNQPHLRDQNRISGGDLQLHDTLKMSELIHELVISLDNKQAFPVLQDMILLEDEIKKHPNSVGALINSFPDHLRDRVFAYSRSQDWFKVLFDGGILDAKSFEIMNRLVKHVRSSESYPLEQLILRCWAAQDKLSDFLRQIDGEDSIKILRMLPKGLSVSLGREVIPGRWAVLLDKKEDKSLRDFPELKIHQYLKKLNEVQPLRDSTVLESYKKDLELIDYLRTLDPIVEKEVYLAAGSNSVLSQLRSPFYPVLEANPEDLKGFVAMISVEDWALSLFNVPKTARLNIEKCFSDRQKFMLIDVLKKLDRSTASDQERMSVARDQIGAMWEGYRQTELANKPTKEDQNETQNHAA